MQKSVTLIVFAGLMAGCAAQAPSPIPDVGMSPSVSNAQIATCSAALDDMTDGEIAVVGSEFSEANSAVYMTVGPQAAPWQCVISKRGELAGLTFLGDEGRL